MVISKQSYMLEGLGEVHCRLLRSQKRINQRNTNLHLGIKVTYRVEFNIRTAQILFPGQRRFSLSKCLYVLGFKFYWHPSTMITFQNNQLLTPTPNQRTNGIPT